MKKDIYFYRNVFLNLLDALYKFNGAGGNLHILVDDLNIDWPSIYFLYERLRSMECIKETDPVQLAIERSILTIFVSHNESDRHFILHGWS